MSPARKTAVAPASLRQIADQSGMEGFAGGQFHLAGGKPGHPAVPGVDRSHPGSSADLETVFQ
jgi:hypothetical protein